MAITIAFSCVLKLKYIRFVAHCEESNGQLEKDCQKSENIMQSLDASCAPQTGTSRQKLQRCAAPPYKFL
eukprot:4015020-Amphidinium_carterae.1